MVATCLFGGIISPIEGPKAGLGFIDGIIGSDE